MRLVRGIWKVLGFQAKAVLLVVNTSRFTCECAVQKISRIELDTGLCG